MIRIVVAIIFSCSLAAGQGFSLFFSTDGTEVAASGAGGSSASPGNYTAVFRDEAVLAMTPGSSGSAVALRTTWAAFFGDEDGDGNFTEGVVGNLDALHLRSGASNPPTVFGFFVSFSNDAGPGGILFGQTVSDGDVFRITPGGGIVPFITEAQITQAMGPAADVDVNAFTVDDATGDLYWSLTTTHFVNGIMLQDGGLVRLPAASYVANGDGTVASVTPGGAQVALFEAHLDIFYANAGQGTVGDLDGIALDPAGGTFIGPLGIPLPHFWFAADSPTSGPALVSSLSTGSVATHAGATFANGPALGIGAVDFSGTANSTVTALAWAAADLATRPRVLDVGDPALTTPGVLKVDVGGATPGATFVLLANAATTIPVGSFTGRTPVVALGVPGGFTELYVDDFLDGFFTFTAAFPPILIDSDGHGSRSWSVPAVPPGVGITFQGYDLIAQAISTPMIVVTQ
ncbi:MAG: hypothetical protein CMJ83_05385 [Planctomycetes bacterium]|nr:hypothetical protein [Planctomycetota bacterium]